MSVGRGPGAGDAHRIDPLVRSCLAGQIALDIDVDVAELVLPLRGRDVPGCDLDGVGGRFVDSVADVLRGVVDAASSSLHAPSRARLRTGASSS